MQSCYSLRKIRRQADRRRKAMSKEAKVTRFEVIDHTEAGEGRIIVKYGVTVELSYQDDGRTLKVFIKDK